MQWFPTLLKATIQSVIEIDKNIATETSEFTVYIVVEHGLADPIRPKQYFPGSLQCLYKLDFLGGAGGSEHQHAYNNR